MISEMDKISVAENCEHFKSRSTEIIAGFGSRCQGCASCANYLYENCKIGAYEYVLNEMKHN